MTKVQINSTLIRRINTAHVFHIVRVDPVISQRQISNVSGIDPATVSIIVATLEQNGIVRREAGTRTGKAGRPTSALFINADSGVLVGISVESDLLHIVLTAPDGTRRGALFIEGSLDIDMALGAARRGLNTLLKRENVKRSELFGIGVGLPGMMSLEGRLLLAPNLGWRDIDIAAAFTKALGAPVRVENDTKVAALAEHLFGGSQEVSDFIYMTGRSGIGGGLYLMGELYRGPHGLAGEIGHMKLMPHGRLCGCGAAGCFEAYVSEHAIVTRLAEHGRRFASTEDIRAAALAGDRTVLDVLAESGTYLGLGLANLANILSPRRFVLGGCLATLAPFLLPSARISYETNALAVIRRNIEIVISPLAEFAVPMGGVALAMQHMVEEPPTRLAALRAHR
jgi:predicted NBD/HSP70 family sugar kinase